MSAVPVNSATDTKKALNRHGKDDPAKPEPISPSSDSGVINQPVDGIVKTLASNMRMREQSRTTGTHGALYMGEVSQQVIVMFHALTKIHKHEGQTYTLNYRDFFEQLKKLKEFLKTHPNTLQGEITIEYMQSNPQTFGNMYKYVVQDGKSVKFDGKAMIKDLLEPYAKITGNDALSFIISYLDEEGDSEKTPQQFQAQHQKDSPSKYKLPETLHETEFNHLNTQIQDIKTRMESVRSQVVQGVSMASSENTNVFNIMHSLLKELIQRVDNTIAK